LTRAKSAFAALHCHGGALFQKCITHFDVGKPISGFG
jgi:hypothetical protein